MKGATHNLVVRTRTEVALYVLNHKRGHLRDLENAFKVTLSVVADASVGGLQSFIIDRGEQVHTLEAAKALLSAQAAASPPQADETLDEDEAFDAEFESAVETEETEGLTDAEAGEGEQDGASSRRRRRRRRRGRGGGGDAREASQPQESPEAAYAEQGVDSETDESGSEADEPEEQPAFARNEGQGANGERRPRRRGRRGGRRRRGGGGMDEGAARLVADEFEPPQASEAAGAHAGFDGYAPQIALPEVQPEPIAPTAEPQPADRSPTEAVRPAAAEASLSEKPAPRRSTVREKVSFPSGSPVSETATPVPDTQVAASPPAPAEPAPEARASEAPARRAGWWSRRFGGGQ